MISQWPEERLHQVRWWLAIGWAVLIASLLIDPITPSLSDPSNALSPFHLAAADGLGPSQCVQVQARCLPTHPYSLSARIFWSMIVPIGLLIIFVLGHDSWRKICPLSFFSQLPRALGIQRKRGRRSNADNGRQELVTIDKKSWLGRNHLALQFGLLILGLAFRLLFINSDRNALAAFLIGTIAASILVGYLYAGKSWCQYFCPMAPVEMIFTGPRGLLGKPAHIDAQRGLTQSTCRSVDAKTGQEKSACVGCVSPCIDIDAERSYWEQIANTDRRLVHYGYIGLVLGFYLYFFLYAGNWTYYYSGAWTHDDQQLNSLFSPGFYLWGYPLPVPKLLAAPLTLVACTALSIVLLKLAEKAWIRILRQQGKTPIQSETLHHIFTLSTFAVWNLFWVFGSRPNINLLPQPLQQLFSGLIVLVSSLWLYRTWGRTADQYSRESLANTLRRQIDKQGIDFGKLLSRSSTELKADEVYVLAKVLPDVNHHKRLEVYKNVLETALRGGIVRSAESSLLKELQTSLEISSSEHSEIVALLDIEDPDLLRNRFSQDLETQARLDGYQQSLDVLLQDLLRLGASLDEAVANNHYRIALLRRDYRITEDEHQGILDRLPGQAQGLLKQADVLLLQIQRLSKESEAFRAQSPQPVVFRLLAEAKSNRRIIALKCLLSLLEVLGDTPNAQSLAQRIHDCASDLLPDVLQSGLGAEADWEEHLAADVYAQLTQASPANPQTSDQPQLDLIPVLRRGVSDDLDPLLRALCLSGLAKLDLNQAQAVANDLMAGPQPGLVAETADAILLSQATPSTAGKPRDLTTLDKLFCLSDSEFFNQLPLSSLMDVALPCQVRSYARGATICEMGAVSQEVFILFDGEAEVLIPRPDGSRARVNSIAKGETIGELGVLTRASRSATVTACSQPTTVLVLEAEQLDRLLRQSSPLAIGLMVIISKRLQQLLRRINDADEPSLSP